MDQVETRRTEALIRLVADSTARLDERDDAAMDLGASDDPRARSVLVDIASDPASEYILAASAGESLGEIATRTGPLTDEEVALLRPDAAAEYRAVGLWRRR
ncbi:hypothetical protein ACEZDB_09570 [Streptacidiphilus sp. N1-3]|uniref:Uncharacterized protein n=1 Tax=Streptacidiphilus alkalitolerans TaxID=3342712 RepID=A0ABV6WY35_9ACTN